jgi:hypothetical protein
MFAGGAIGPSPGEDCISVPLILCVLCKKPAFYGS